MTAIPMDITLPTKRKGYSTAWWGMVVLIATEATIFIGLLSAYFFTRATSPDWPQGGIEAPELPRILVFTVVLLASSLPLFWGEAAIRRGRVGRLRVALFLSFVLGLAFLANQALEYSDLKFDVHDVVATGDETLVSWVATATTRGHERVRVSGCTVGRMRGGKIGHTWCYWDAREMLAPLRARSHGSHNLRCVATTS